MKQTNKVAFPAQISDEQEICTHCGATRGNHYDGIQCLLYADTYSSKLTFEPIRSRLEPVEAPHCDECKETTPPVPIFADMDMKLEPVEAVSTTPNCDSCGAEATPSREGFDVTPTDRGDDRREYIVDLCDDCDPKLSTPLPQQRKDGHSALKPDGNGGFEKFDPHPALPQQEEPAMPRDTHGLNVVWSHDDQLFVCRIPEVEGCTGHGDTREAAIAMCEDNLHELLTWKAEGPTQSAEPIAPLLGQDEPKLENEEDLIRHERLVSLKRLVEIRSLKAELTQSLTSLAAARKEIKHLEEFLPTANTYANGYRDGRRDEAMDAKNHSVEASLAEAQTRISELTGERDSYGASLRALSEKELGR